MKINGKTTFTKTVKVELEKEEFDALMCLVGQLTVVDEHRLGLTNFQSGVINRLFENWWDTGNYSRIQELEDE